MAIRLIFGKQNIFISEESEKFILTLDLLHINRATYDTCNVSELIEVDKRLNEAIVLNIERKIVEFLEINKENFYPGLNSDIEIVFDGGPHTINLRSEIGSGIKYLLKLLSFFKEESFITGGWIEVMKEKESTGWAG